MKSYEVLRAAFKQAGCKNVATELGCSLSLVYQWSRGRDGRSEARNPLEVLLRIFRLTGDTRPLECLCEQAGGKFVRGKKLRLLACAECERIIAELQSIVQSGDGRNQTGDRSRKLGVGGKKLGDGSWKLGDGGKNHLPSAISHLPGAREAGGSRCRYRRRDGRCGFSNAQRN